MKETLRKIRNAFIVGVGFLFYPKSSLHTRIASVVVAHGFKIADERYIQHLQSESIFDKMEAMWYLYGILCRDKKFMVLCASSGKHFGSVRLSTLRQLATSCPFCWVGVIAELREITEVDPNDVAEIARQVKMLAADDGLNFNNEAVQKEIEKAKKRGRAQRTLTVEEKQQKNLEIARKLREGEIPLIKENGER